MPTEKANARMLMIIVSVIGLIFAIVMVILFFNAAPALSDLPEHRTYTDAPACLKCHLIGDAKESPTMPHINVGACHLCHNLAEEQQEGVPQ
ncbi:MAG: hypothetical protein OXP71_02925 [Candidatus Poribacteria bacterium]|nr:hypothetical protein [Candidatus Poribacteria bacterium]